MRNLLAVANWATRASFLALAVLALVEWRRRKGRPAAWAAATFGVMAAVEIGRASCRERV